jgi:hypothetical protein
MSMLEAALRYACRGFAVFPANGKRPYTDHGLHDASTDPETIERWWRRWPAANIAVRTGSVSGLLVLDADDLDSLHELEREHGQLPRTASVVTPRGGQHLWLRHSGGVASSASRLKPGLDIRAENAYIIAPPSPGYVVDEEAPLAEPPVWLLERLRNGARAAAPKVGDEIPRGKRNPTLTSLAGSMRRRGMGEAEILAALRVANRERCRPPLDEEEVERVAKSVARYDPAEAPTRPRAANEQVDGGELLDALAGFITRFVVLPSERVADLLALWTVHTHSLAASWATPYLRIVSATPECGKSLLMEILAVLVRRGWYAVNPSVAVLYRKIARDEPSVLLDEMDNYPLDERRDALAVLNSGYKRGAMVPRCTESGELQEFAVFCPKAYAGLDERQLVDTLLSRSITIRLEKRLASEPVEMWLAALSEPQAVPLRERCEQWGEQNVEALRDVRPELPAGMVNRRAEVWWSLLAIAEHVGGAWPSRARAAAEELSSGDTDAVSDQVQLLMDIRDAFASEEVISTATLLDRLNGLEESPWGGRRRGEGLDARGLARMLRPFKIRPRSVRAEGGSKGYHFDQFEDAFARHLSQAAQAAQAAQPATGLEPDVPDVPDVPDIQGGAR